MGKALCRGRDQREGIVGGAAVYKENRVTVVIPAYNEQKHIACVIKDIPHFVDLIIVVNDASQDATSKCIEEIGEPRVVLVESPVNQGVGGSTIKGYQMALTMGSDVIAKVDGDGQMPLARLSNLLDAIIDEGYHYSKGNRFLESTTLRQMPKIRLIGNSLLTFLTKLASGYWNVFDPQNGFTAISAPCLEKINLDRIHRRFFFENDMLVQLSIHNYRVKDVPIPTIYGDEESGIRISSILCVFPWLLLNRFIYRVYQKYILRDFSPIALFLGSGSLLMGWGIGFGIYLWIKSMLTNVHTSTGTVMLAVLPLILGFQLVLQALVLDIQETPR